MFVLQLANRQPIGGCNILLRPKEGNMFASIITYCYSILRKVADQIACSVGNGEGLSIFDVSR